MCGIGGALSNTRDLESLMPLILEDQRRRGPDYSSLITLSEDNMQISLSHNRLAILDISDQSNQPFVDVRTGAYIVFNGEIYNYIELKRELEAAGERFETQSDTEVLLRAYLVWGAKAFAKFNGMFAFAIWNPATRTLTLARDRFGVKPCYYLNRQNQFAFASNTTALARFFSPGFDFDYLSRGIALNLYENCEGSSPFADIQSLPPGHYLEVTPTGNRLNSYYDFALEVEREASRLAPLSDSRIEVELRELLEDAIRLRLRSDVPVTVSLSGGLDSALVTSMIPLHRRRDFTAFTFGDPALSKSEGRLAKETADMLGVGLKYVTIQNKELPELFERTLLHQGAPFSHPSVIAQNRVFEEIQRHGYKVSLGGQGADEVFLGYRKFQFFNLRQLRREHRWFGFTGAAIGLTKMLAAEAHNMRDSLLYHGGRYAHMHEAQSAVQHTQGKTFALGFHSYKDLRDRQIADIGPASLLTLLRYEDRNSMGHSVESRMPFIDYRVAQFGTALPTRMKIRNGYGKWILRRLADNRLPRSIVGTRAKQAFALDAHEWMREGLGQHIHARVAKHIQKLESVFSPVAIAALKERRTYLNPKNFPLIVSAYWVSTRL